MTVTGWFSSLSKEERKAMLAELHRARLNLTPQEYINPLIKLLEGEHETLLQRK